MSRRVRICGGKATGTVERVRADGTYEVLWETGARCAVPASWVEADMLTCASCGTVFAAERSTRRYCSEVCKQRAKRARKRHAKDHPSQDMADPAAAPESAPREAQTAILGPA